MSSFNVYDIGKINLVSGAGTTSSITGAAQIDNNNSDRYWVFKTFIVNNPSATTTTEIRVMRRNPGVEWELFRCYLAPKETVVAISQDQPHIITQSHGIKIKSSDVASVNYYYCYEDIHEYGV